VLLLLQAVQVQVQVQRFNIEYNLTTTS
jgi:hypothetical protein